MTNNIYSFQKKTTTWQLHVVESLETIIVYYELSNVLQAYWFCQIPKINSVPLWPHYWIFFKTKKQLELSILYWKAFWKKNENMVWKSFIVKLFTKMQMHIPIWRFCMRLLWSVPVLLLTAKEGSLNTILSKQITEICWK